MSLPKFDRSDTMKRRISGAIERIHAVSPDARFGQIIENATRAIGGPRIVDLFMMEDVTLAALLEAYADRVGA